MIGRDSLKNHSVIELMLKTYQFLIVRFIITVCAFVPGYWAIINGIRLGNKHLGVHMLIFDIAFGYAGLALFFGYISFIKNYSTHLVRFAQIASVTAIINQEPVKGSMFLYGLKMMFKRFGSVSFVYLSNKLISSALTQISRWIIEKGDFLPEFLKSGFAGRLISAILKTVVLHVDEVVISYMYKNSEVSFWQGATDGISLYVRSWKSILKATFFSVLWMKVFSFTLNLCVFLFSVWFLWGKGFLAVVNFYILYRIIMMICRATFVEPYQTISMIIGFYENSKDKQEIAGLQETLERVSYAFNDMLLRRKQMDSSIVTEMADLITSNLQSDSTSNPFDKISGVLNKRGSNSGVDG